MEVSMEKKIENNRNARTVNSEELAVERLGRMIDEAFKRPIPVCKGGRVFRFSTRVQPNKKE